MGERGDTLIKVFPQVQERPEPAAMIVVQNISTTRNIPTTTTTLNITTTQEHEIQLRVQGERTGLTDPCSKD